MWQIAVLICLAGIIVYLFYFALIFKKKNSLLSTVFFFIGLFFLLLMVDVSGKIIKEEWTTLDGSINITKNLTAKNVSASEHFFGDGSKLTGIAGGGIWTNDSGNATFDGDVNITGLYYSNGSQVTGWDGQSDLAIANGVKLTGGYLRIGATGTPAKMDGSGDLFIQDELEIEGQTYFYNNVEVDQNRWFKFASGGKAAFLWSTAGYDHFVLGLKLGSTSYPGYFIISEYADMSTDWGHAVTANPRMYIQSADAGSKSDYISFWHDQTDAYIEGGTGNLNISAVDGDIILDPTGNEVIVEGDVNITGNITSENAFLPQYIFSHTNATIPVLAVNAWTNITFDQEDTDVKQSISHTYNDATNHTFTVMKDGIYNIDYDLDVEDTSVSASDINVAGRLTFINGSEIIGSVFETDITKQGVEAELTHNFLMSCKAGEQFIFQFAASDADVQISTHGTFGVHTDSATILMNKIANLP